MCKNVGKHELMAFLESTMSAHGDFRKRSDVESPERVIRSKKLKFAKYAGTKLNDGNQATVLFEVASSSHEDDGKTYKNLIVIPGLTQAYKNNPSYTTIAQSLKNSDVQVKCDCNDFKYRFEYWTNKNKDLAKVGDSSENYAISHSPDKTNPNNDKGAFCKHLLKVTSVFLFNISKISNDMKAMNLDNTQEPLTENAQKEEGAIVLDKDTDDFMQSIIESEAHVDEALAKDKGLTEEDRTEIKEVLIKDEQPEEIEDPISTDDEDINLIKDEEPEAIEEEFTEENLQKEAEPESVEPLEEEVVLEKDRALEEDDDIETAL